jgi:hypothetical protein
MTLPQSPGGAGELWGLVGSRGPDPGPIPGQTSHQGHFGVRLGHYSKLSQARRVLNHGPMSHFMHHHLGHSWGHFRVQNGAT